MDKKRKKENVQIQYPLKINTYLILILCNSTLNSFLGEYLNNQ